MYFDLKNALKLLKIIHEYVFDSISISKPQFVLNFFDEFKLLESCMIFLVGNNRAVRFFTKSYSVFPK